jgi:hypothetical protein
MDLFRHGERGCSTGSHAGHGAAGARALAAGVRRARAGRKRALAVLALVVAAGCGPSPANFPPDEHHDILLASTEAGGGPLAADFDFSEPVPVFLSATLGGLNLYSSTDPGFMLLDVDEPDEGFFAIEDDVTVSFEVTALDPGVQVKFEDETLDEVGDSVVLGTTPELHQHGEWQVVVPEGVTSGSFALSFRLTTDSPAYADSEPSTMILTLSDEEPEEEE